MNASSLRNTPHSYGHVARLLHWTSVFLLTLVIIYTPDSFSSETKNTTAELHIVLGGMFLLILLMRFIWRQVNPNPIHSYSIALYQKLIAISLHRTIYLVMLIQCATGCLLTLTQSKPTDFFGVFRLMPLFENPLISTLTLNTHVFVSSMIYPLLFIHISAAIYHQVFGVVEHGARGEVGSASTRAS